MSKKFVNVFVLGAGASVDYGLPIWCELSELLIRHIEENKAQIPAADVSILLRELGQIGTGKKYTTVDQMISEFSRETTDFAETTAAMFKEVRTILEQRVRPETVGWIERFVKSNDLEILLRNEATNNSPVFINFNYDDILLLKIVEFFNGKYANTSNLTKAEWRANTGYNFENRFKNCARDIFHPHGILYLFDKDTIKIGEKTHCRPTTKTFMNARTSGENQLVSGWNSGGDNAVSCLDARDHFTFADIKKRINELTGGGQGGVDIRLIVLGVGPDSLAFNLDKIFGGQAFAVRQIHYTCTEDDEMHIYERYFDGFQATSQRYENCQELVEKNTFIPFN